MLINHTNEFNNIVDLTGGYCYLITSHAFHWHLNIGSSYRDDPCTIGTSSPYITKTTKCQNSFDRAQGSSSCSLLISAKYMGKCYLMSISELLRWHVTYQVDVVRKVEPRCYEPERKSSNTERHVKSVAESESREPGNRIWFCTLSSGAWWNFVTAKHI